MSRLVLIRHAQASFGAANYDQLSEMGYQQAKILGDHFAESELMPNTIYVGPLQRHHQTLEMVQKAYLERGMSLPEPILLQELDEHRGTEFSKLIMPHLLKTDLQLQKIAAEGGKRKAMKMFLYVMENWAKGTLDTSPFPHIQSWKDFRATVNRGMQKMLEDNRDKKNQIVLAFTSGGTISAAVGFALEMRNEARVIELNGIVQNTSLTEFLFTKDRMTFKSFNEVSHLVDERMITFV